jgi:hypothetical protein
MHLAGLYILKELKFFDSVINFFPLSKDKIQTRIDKEEVLIKANLKKRLGSIGELPFTNFLYKLFVFNPEKMKDERFYPGRMYSYTCIKK